MYDLLLRLKLMKNPEFQDLIQYTLLSVLMAGFLVTAVVDACRELRRASPRYLRRWHH